MARSSDFHRCSTAYARQGRHASARASARRPFVSPIAFSTATSGCGKASGQASARMAMYCAVHGPTPGMRSSAASVSSTGAAGSRRSAPRATSCARAAMARAREPMMPSAAISDGAVAAMRAGRREQAAEPRVRRLDRLAEGAGEAPGDRRRGRHRHLLAEDRAHRDLESVDRAGQAQSRVRLRERAQRRRDLVGAAREVEEQLHAGEERAARRPRAWRSPSPAAPTCAARARPRSSPRAPSRRAEADRAAVASPSTASTPAIRAPLEEGEHARPSRRAGGRRGRRRAGPPRRARATPCAARSASSGSACGRGR